MKLAEAYAYALYELSEEVTGVTRDEEYIERFLVLLSKRGHSTLLPRILREYERIKERFTEKESNVLVCAKQSDIKRYSDEIKEHIQDTDSAEVEAQIDETLIGGYVFKSGEIVVDNSYKKMLLSLYRKSLA